MNIHTHKLGRLIALLSVSAVSAAAGPVQDYTGLYFHRFEGTFTGTEWSTWGAIEGENRYEFSDLSSQGTYATTINADSSFTFDFNQGIGSFDDARNQGDIDFTISGGFNFESHFVRAAHTDDRFRVFDGDHIDGDTSLSGEWDATVSLVNPETDQQIAQTNQDYTVLVENDTIRLTDASGAFHQGVWFEDDQAGFRAIGSTVFNPRYSSFDGSLTSSSRDVLGDLRVIDDNTMTFAVFFQSQDTLGEQVQTMQYIELSRTPTPGTTMIVASGALVMGRRRRD